MPMLPDSANSWSSMRNGSAHASSSFAGDAREIGFALVVLDQYHELVTALPCDEIRAAEAALQPPRDVPQHHVTGAVAERVVHELEAVEVDEHHRETPAVPAHPLQRADQRQLKRNPVGQPGESVVLRQETDALLGSLALGDVAPGAPVAGETALVVEDGLAADRRPTHAVTSAEAEDEIPERSARREQPAMLIPLRIIEIEDGVLLPPAAPHRAVAPVLRGTWRRGRESGESKIGVLLPEPVRRQLGQIAEALLAVPQQRLGLLPFADVGHAHQMHRCLWHIEARDDGLSPEGAPAAGPELQIASHAESASESSKTARQLAHGQRPYEELGPPQRDQLRAVRRLEQAHRPGVAVEDAPARDIAQEKGVTRPPRTRH